MFSLSIARWLTDVDDEDTTAENYTPQGTSPSAHSARLNAVTYDAAIFNVAHMPRAGQLDPATPEETRSALMLIRQFLRLDKSVRQQLNGQSSPPIARAVLTTLWESPRVGFHRSERRGLKGVDLRGKLLLIPWSIEAFDLLKAQGGVKNLVLEHVTPVESLWSQLGRIDEEAEDEAGWLTNAEGYLVEHYTLAVLTRTQAAAIDSLPNFKTRGWPRRPFMRYVAAQELLPQSVSFDVGNFVHPGRA